MALPGFTAESSQGYDSTQYSENVSFKSDSAERIIPAAPYWGPFRREECLPGGRGRKYSSIIHGVEWGQSWEAACRNTPAWIRGEDGLTHKYYAKRCDNQGLNMWGIFEVCEESCGCGDLGVIETPFYSRP